MTPFEGNVSNTGPGEGENPFSNNGAITVFPRSRLSMERCTMTGNRNGVDDSSGLGEYVKCLFNDNTRDGGFTRQPRFEMDLSRGATVRQCAIFGPVRDPLSAIRPTDNRLEASAPGETREDGPSWWKEVGYHQENPNARPR